MLPRVRARTRSLNIWFRQVFMLHRVRARTVPLITALPW